MPIPKTLQHAVNHLGVRYGLSPTYLTSLLMYAIFPAKMMHQKQRLEDTNPHSPIDFKYINSSKSKEATHCIIHFVGNGADALSHLFINSTIPLIPSEDTEYLFWNYPGVGLSYATSNHSDEVVEAGYQLVKDHLSRRHGNPHQVTLHGHSIGGGIASQVAARLHQEGIKVDLVVDRSFGKISDVIPVSLHTYFKHHTYGPLLSSIITCAAFSALPGIWIAELLQSLNVLFATALAYLGNWDTTLGIGEAFNGLAFGFEFCFNIINSIIGGALILAGLIVGCLIGASIGTILQLFGTQMPMQTAFDVVLSSTVGNLETQNALKSILARDEHGHITIINSENDGIIRPQASANHGLGFTNDFSRDLEQIPALWKNIKSFWHQDSGHCGALFDAPISELKFEA